MSLQWPSNEGQFWLHFCSVCTRMTFLKHWLSSTYMLITSILLELETTSRGVWRKGQPSHGYSDQLFQQWRLILHETRTTAITFHLNNCLANQFISTCVQYSYWNSIQLSHSGEENSTIAWHTGLMRWNSWKWRSLPILPWYENFREPPGKQTLRSFLHLYWPCYLV